MVGYSSLLQEMAERYDKIDDMKAQGIAETAKTTRAERKLTEACRCPGTAEVGGVQAKPGGLTCLVHSRLWRSRCLASAATKSPNLAGETGQVLYRVGQELLPHTLPTTNALRPDRF